MTQVKKVLTFSNVVAFVALFVALGGSVYAAGKINGREIKANSIPGNRVKAKTLTKNQIKPKTLTGAQIQAGSLTGAQIKAGSLTGAQIQTGSLTGAQIDTASLSGVTASKLSSLQYVNVAVPLGSGGNGNTGTADCPSGTNVIGGGATVTNDELDFVNDSSPNSTRNGWTATGFGEPGSTMTITAICTAAASVSG